MKTLKQRIKQYSFWVALSTAVAGGATAISALLGATIDVKAIESIIMSLCSVLVALGVVILPPKDKAENSSNNINTKDSLPAKTDEQTKTQDDAQAETQDDAKTDAQAEIK